MVEYYEQKTTQIIPVIAGVLLIIVGACIAFIPGMTLTLVTAIAGISFFLSGVLRIIQYVRVGRYMPFAKNELPIAIICILIGIIFMIDPLVVGNFIVWICAAALIIYGIVEVFTALRKKKAYNANWQFDICIAVLACIGAIFVLAFPAIIGLIIGLFVIANGVMTIQSGLPRKQ